MGRLSLREIDITIALDNVLRFLRLAMPIATLLALGWTAWKLKQREKFALPLILAIALAAVSVCAHVIIKFQVLTAAFFSLFLIHAFSFSLLRAPRPD